MDIISFEALGASLNAVKVPSMSSMPPPAILGSVTWPEFTLRITLPILTSIRSHIVSDHPSPAGTGFGANTLPVCDSNKQIISVDRSLWLISTLSGMQQPTGYVRFVLYLPNSGFDGVRSSICKY